MANLGQKGGIYLIRFRYQGTEYKRSLKTRIDREAAAAKNTVELTIHRLLTGLLKLPEGVEVGDFIVSGGTITTPRPADTPVECPSTTELIREYLESQKNLLAESYHYSQEIHLRHLVRHLGQLAEAPCDRIRQKQIEGFIQSRLRIRNPGTVARERVTLLQFYKWVASREGLQGYLSPTATLAAIKHGSDRPPFRTIEEINGIIARGGLDEDQALDLWGCLYLNPQEIGKLLATVQVNARDPVSFLLHAIPAYTGMRRGEVLRLSWLDVDLDNGYITARSRKQSRTRSETIRRIDLHAELHSHLTEWRKKHPKGQYVVCAAATCGPLDRGRANRLFWQPMRGTDWCLDTGKNWFKIGFHTYRHSFASNLAAAGVDQRLIDEFMGHQTEAMRRRYRHLTPRNRRSAIESFSLAVPAATSDGSCRGT